MEYGGEVAVLLPTVAPPTFTDDRGKCIANAFNCSLSQRERKLVCVTSGNSQFGAHLVRKLLARGYVVRVTIQHQANIEDMKEHLREEEMKQLESIVVARMGNLDSLCDAFRGCHVVFHTSSFIDPRGITGYTERMAFFETEAARNVIEACSRTAYVKRCIFTSSLLASIWRWEDMERVTDETCWSDEEFCRENKLWLALGKTRAEKLAWRKSRELKVRLVTVCPGLLMAPSFPNALSENSIPYLKGGQAMLERGVLGIEDVAKVAEAHVYIYEDMDYGACGRYLCFRRVISSLEEAIQIENSVKMHGLLSGESNVVLSGENDEILGKLSNSKLSKLLLRASHRLSCRP